MDIIIHTKWFSLNNQKCQIQPTLINLHPNEYSQEFHYHLLAVKLDKSVGSFNIFNAYNTCNKC